MSKFKIGDKVRLLERGLADENGSIPAGSILTVSEPLEDYYLNLSLVGTDAIEDHPEWFELVEPAKDVWDGVGIPPVGTVCEVMVGGLPSVAFDWEQCTILLINEGADGTQQICTRDFRGDLAIYYIGHDAVYFRPIRTPEQQQADIAAAKREEDIMTIASMIGHGTFYEDAERLYEAGLRFTEDKE